MLTPEGEDLVLARGARGSDWLVNGNAELASQVVETFTRPEYQAGLAEGMDAPPINLDVVADADVIEPYAWLASDFAQRIFRAPQPQVRNIEVSHALALMEPVAPHVGDIVQGYLGGDVTDLRAALVELSDAFSAARDAAIERAVADGASVTHADWEFPDWVRGEDYTY